MAQDLRERVTDFLSDVHSIEEQALQQLKTAPDVAGEPEFARALERHREETEGHERRVRSLLESRGESPSRVKDAVLRAGGSGFMLFARSQTDTPGKLASHATSYEALEWASYDLLARVAERAGEPEVADAARAIQQEERTMMERIEAVLDRTADASLREASDDDLRDHLRRYLADAHAIEGQSIELLEGGDEMAEGTPLQAVFRKHLGETRRQRDRIEGRLEAIGGKPSLIKDAAMRLGGLNWGMFFRAQPDTPARLAAFAYAFEHLEIGGYAQLHRVAERAGDRETSETVEEILDEERRAADEIADAIDGTLEAVLASGRV